MVTYKPIPIGPEADAWWREGLLYFWSSLNNAYVRDTTKEIEHSPTRYRYGGIKYAILVEE